ncbi:stealth family protein [Planotetraspora phitsanulokensis]|uniref:Exopolysaccharide phosphotransferase n=1 Tax=Planotetraspora phitsanulokensis TaxID=575192 RepID=A0A8J3U930_9ACTN|nr:stealth family protein [Planotetraspora phitsanulokensis]GII40525.1 exopolysaccharide phosphotransferase [Planotetraspora phitsanulokensis]
MPVITLYRQLQGRLPSGESTPRSALIREDASPLQAQRETLDIVCRRLSAAKVAYFCVRPMPGHPPVVAVAQRDRERALTTLASSGRPLLAARLPYGKGARGRAPEEIGRMRPLKRVAAQLHDAWAVRVGLYFTSPSRTLTIGPEHGCDLEFWAKQKGMLIAPRPNPACASVPAKAKAVQGGEELFNTLVSAGQGVRTYRTRPEFTRRLVGDIDFPIDAVYTWVDGADPAWRARRDQALAEGGGPTGTLSEMATTEARFTSREELRYSLRSLLTYAPWINRVWIVTAGQTPPWLDTTHPMVRVVDHKEIFNDPSVLPVFNSHAIETQLHHIDGLAEHFLYLNDDFFLGRPLPSRTFFEANGITRFFPSLAHVPFGAPESEESPVHAAGMNNRRMLEDLSGRTLTQKLKHAPYALRRSVLYELEERFNDEFEATSRSRFRRTSDISALSSLVHYYSYLNGRAVPGNVEYTYVDLALRKTPAKLRRMLARRWHDAFCLNDTAPTTPEQDALLVRFLRAYYPTPVPFELDQGGSPARRS